MTRPRPVGEPLARPWLRWAGAAAWMVIIWMMSSQSGAESSAYSGLLARLLGDRSGLLDPDTAQAVVRKGAHVAEYLVLGGLIAWAWRAWPGVAGPGNPSRVGAVVVPVLVAVVYAASDEWHQRFVDGRSGQVGDVAIDSLGVVLGVAFVTACSRRSARRRPITDGH